jgi:lantibiotic modifying enzyme
VIERLAERAERNPEGIAWFSPPEILPDFQRGPYPKGLYNLGASHGMAGVIAVLAAACRAGVATGTARPLLDGAMTWLLARQTEGREFRFPHYFHPNPENTVPRTSRLAWCYGDPGMAAIFLLAAQAVGEPAWEREALGVALAAAARPFEGSLIRDAGLCHGATGLGHLFNRMYQATGEEKLAEAARVWYRTALDFQEPGQGIAGFRSWAADISGVSDWRDDPGFLEGAAGVGLALLAAVSPVDPAWDRLLLVNT